MDTYSLALYVHLLALLAAIAAASLMHFAEARRFAANTRLEVLPWLGLAKSVSRVFPLSLLVLLGSGAYLVHKIWTWDTGWVQAGIVGVVVLFASGIAIGKRSAAFAKALLAAQDGPLSPELRARNHDRIVSALSFMSIRSAGISSWSFSSNSYPWPGLSRRTRRTAGSVNRSSLARTCQRPGPSRRRPRAWRGSPLRPVTPLLRASYSVKHT